MARQYPNKPVCARPAGMPPSHESLADALGIQESMPPIRRQNRQSNRAEGSRHEEEAADFLRQQGYKILERNYRDRFGEIDIVAREGPYLAFVEVKYRKDAKSGYPEEAVPAAKQRRIRHTASWYLYRHGLSDETPCRFDVVSILGGEITLIRDAF